MSNKWQKKFFIFWSDAEDFIFKLQQERKDQGVKIKIENDYDGVKVSYI